MMPKFIHIIANNIERTPVTIRVEAISHILKLPTCFQIVLTNGEKITTLEDVESKIKEAY